MNNFASLLVYSAVTIKRCKMFRFFRKRSRLDMLKEQYKQLQQEAYQVSHTNRRKSDKILAQAEAIARQIDRMEAERLNQHQA